MDFFFNNIFQEIISLSIDLCLVIHNIGSKHDRETIAFKLTFTLLTLHTSLLQEFLGIFRYAANEFYLDIFTPSLLREWVCTEVPCSRGRLPVG